VLKKLAVVLAVLLGTLLVYAATRPDSLHVERSVTIQAPPETVFALIADFHRWAAWSPWEKMDPAMTRAYSGSPSGRGAVYEWKGNNQVGSGRMEITDTAAPSRVAIQVDFVEPFEGHNVATFELVPQSGTTNVRWSMDAPSPYLAKLMGVFVDMDAMIGTDFEAGLANLKAIAEQ
jgi:uncharacterized protein YndB with AHSA1/START domain